MRYVDYVYDIVRLDCEGMDSIYGDYIRQMVGVYGFNALHEANLIESCGVVHGRQLYVLCEKNVTVHSGKCDVCGEFYDEYNVKYDVVVDYCPDCSHAIEDLIKSLKKGE